MSLPRRAALNGVLKPPEEQPCTLSYAKEHLLTRDDQGDQSVAGWTPGQGQALGEVTDPWDFLFFSSPGHATHAGRPDAGDWQL